jgi:hypothetical protein
MEKMQVRLGWQNGVGENPDPPARISATGISAPSIALTADRRDLPDASSPTSSE